MILDAFLLAALAAAPLGGVELRERWVYGAFNLLVNENADKLEGILRRAVRAGYNGILLADSKFARLADMEVPYFKNVERVKRLARELGIEVVPAVFRSATRATSSPATPTSPRPYPSAMPCSRSSVVWPARPPTLPWPSATWGSGTGRTRT